MSAVRSVRVVLHRALVRELMARGFSQHRIADEAAVDIRSIERLMSFATGLHPGFAARLMAFAGNVLIERRKQFEAVKARTGSEFRDLGSHKPGPASISLPRLSILEPA